MAKIVLLLGGARSGKSRFAQQLARQIGGHRVLFVATAEAGDEEMARRIGLHQQSRPQEWQLLEAPQGVGQALGSAPGEYQAVIVDCLTLLISNVLLDCGVGQWQEAEARVRRETQSLLSACGARDGTVIIVSGEVGLGLVPDNLLGRLFRDLVGWANQAIADASDATYLLIAGLPVEVKALARSVEEAGGGKEIRR